MDPAARIVLWLLAALTAFALLSWATDPAQALLVLTFGGAALLALRAARHAERNH